MTKKLRERLQQIRAILMDVDGVLTDGRIIYSSDGLEIKRFDVKDGYGIALAREKGFHLGIITGRASDIVLRRAAELGIDDIYQGVIDKTKPFEEFKKKHGLADRQVAFIGDDVLDLPVLKCVGFSAAPKNAHPSVKMAVHYVAAKSGGNGAVREIIDLIFSARELPGD